MGSTFWKRVTLDPQLSLYIPALREMGYDPRGAIYDVLRKPSLEPYKATPVEARKYKAEKSRACPECKKKKPSYEAPHHFNPLLEGDNLVMPAAMGDGTGLLSCTAGRIITEPGGELYANQHEHDESPEAYRDRCLAAISEDPSRYFARGIVVRLEADEREAAADVWQTAGLMRDARRLQIYPRNPDSCLEWGRECDYLGVCSGMADINDPMLFKHEADANSELVGAGDLLTQSGMRCYRKCPRRYQLRYVLRQRPLKKADTLSTGTSIHEALDVYRRTGGDLDAARAALVTEDVYVRAKEEAMLIGYAARWGKPVGIVAVEQQFEISLINPETGGVSRTWRLGGKVDAIVSADAVKEMMR
jgi:hypothetical protein